MLYYHKLYLPKSKREIKLCVSAPSNRDGIEFDSLYLLDGQNAFKDSNASFGRSIRATKYLSIAAREYNKRIIGIAIYNSSSDQGRLNEYSPFKLVAPESNWTNNPKICDSFCEDLKNTIIPFIEKKYPVKKEKESRAIYGSSLAAVTALYLGAKYDLFQNLGLFSTASFLFDNDLYKFLDEKDLKGLKCFIYVGKKEKSDDLFDESTYLNASIKLNNYLKKKKAITRFIVSVNGSHNEASWENVLFDFISFTYCDDIIYKL